MIDLEDISLLTQKVQSVYVPGTSEHIVCTILLRLLPLAREVLLLADTGTLPDGDGCNDISTALWAEAWAEKILRPLESEAE